LKIDPVAIRKKEKELLAQYLAEQKLEKKRLKEMLVADDEYKTKCELTEARADVQREAKAATERETGAKREEVIVSSDSEDKQNQKEAKEKETRARLEMKSDEKETSVVVAEKSNVVIVEVPRSIKSVSSRSKRSEKK
jgi:hypothetical protein